MTLVPDLFGRAPKGPNRLARLAVEVHQSEDAVAVHEVRRWADLRKAQVDLQARATLIDEGLNLDLAAYDAGMEKAANDPVKEELVLRYVQDQNSANRATIKRAMD